MNRDHNSGRPQDLSGTKMPENLKPDIENGTVRPAEVNLQSQLNEDDDQAWRRAGGAPMKSPQQPNPDA